jgi:cupin 2 domain-containing protein
MQANNIFSAGNLPKIADQEQFETLCSDQNLRIERIISHGSITPPDQWYDQQENEWVLLIQGKASLEFENGKMLHLGSGDYIFLPARLKHRVAYTSKTPSCIWLAVHFK